MSLLKPAGEDISPVAPQCVMNDLKFMKKSISSTVSFSKKLLIQSLTISYVTAHAKMSHLSVKTYSCFITYSNRAHTEQKYYTSMPSIFMLFPEI